METNLKTTDKTDNWEYKGFAIFIMALVIYVTGKGGPSEVLRYSHGPLDSAMFFAAIVFIGWLLLPRRNKSASEKGAGNGVAFRLGKSLKRVLGGSKG